MNRTLHPIALVRSGRISLCVSLGLLFLVSSLWSGLVHAQLRVLIKFDQTEHTLHRLVEMKSGHAASDAISAMRAKSSPAEKQPGMVSVVWKAADGSVLHQESMVDPRLTHAPLSGAGSSPALIGLNNGAYMVSGPSDSRFLEISLPANFSLSLPAQTWQFELKP